jgi:hypothetical protein
LSSRFINAQIRRSWMNKCPLNSNQRPPHL